MDVAMKSRIRSFTSMIPVVCLTLACAVGVDGANAAPPEPLKERVRFGELNLNSPAGAKVLYSRLRRAAQKVCAPLEGREGRQRSDWQVCFDEAVASAVASVNRPTLTDLHRQSTPRADWENS